MDVQRDELQRITAMLEQAREGEPRALEGVMDMVYPRLLRIAEQRLREFPASGPGRTLEPAALVDETYLKLIRQRARYDSRGHFLAVASRLMLRVLIDHERLRRRDKRGGGLVRVSLSEADSVAMPAADVTVEAFAEALELLERLNPRAAEIVKARVLWGLTVPEVADSLEISVRTVEREWQFAQRWLELELARNDGR